MAGYNLAIGLVVPERHGTITGLVSVMTALGSVFFTFVGREVLTAGPSLYVVLAGLVFALAAVPALKLASSAGRRWAHAGRLGAPCRVAGFANSLPARAHRSIRPAA
ncbi:hypothetical protein [Mycobacterium sp. C31M]